MAYGIRIKNPNSGYVSIDQDYPNLALIGKFSVTSSATVFPGASGVTISLVSFSITSTIMPIIAARHATSAQMFTLLSMEVSGSTWTYYYLVNGLSQPMVFYAFGKPQDLGSGWGVRIKKDGEVKFDSRNKYLRRIAKSNGQQVANTPESGSFPYSGTFAAVISFSGVYYEKQVEFIGFYRVTENGSKSGVSVNSSNWSIGGMPYISRLYETGVNPGGSATYFAKRGPVTFIDVTGY